MVEKEKGAAAAIGEIVKAGVSLVTGKKEAPKASPQPKAVDQLKTRAEGRLKPKAAPETKKWTEEVVAGLKRGELPPEPQVTRAVTESQQIIAKTQAAKQTQWLVGEKGAPQSELVAQVVADIASSKLTNDPDYLLAKGAQLRWAITAETPVDVQAEARYFLRKIHQKVLEGQQAAGRLPLEKTIVEGQEVWTPRLKNGAVQLSPKEQDLFNTIGHNLTGVESGMAAPRAPRASIKIWNGKTTGNKDLDRVLTTLQNQFDNAPHYLGDHKFVDQAIRDIAKFNAAEIKRAGTDPLGELGGLFTDLQAELARQYRGADIDQPWSSWQMSSERRKQLILYPEWAFTEVYRQINTTVDFFAEGSMTEAIEMDVRRMGQYYADAKYVEDIREIMLDPNYRKEIEVGYGVGVVEGNEAAHPFYRDRVRRLKEVNDKINSQEHLLRTYGVAKYGLEMKKFGDSAANFGDSGVYRVKMNNGGLTGLAYHLYDSIGQDMGISDESGCAIRVTGREVELLKAQVRLAFQDNRKVLNEIYKESWEQQGEKNVQNIEKGMRIAPRNLELTDDAIEGIIREAEMLYTVTLRDVAMTDRGLSPWEAKGQNGQSVQYAGTRGIELALRGRSPLRWLINRWDLMPPPGQLVLREMAHEYAVASGVEHSVDEWVKQTVGNDARKEELARYALNLVEKTEKNPQKLADLEESLLKFHFAFDREGHDLFNPPKIIKELNNQQLKEILMYKEGIKYADTVLGSYDYEGATWVSEEKVKQSQRIWGKEKGKVIFLSDQKRQAGKDLLSAENEKSLDKARHALVHGDRDEPGVLASMAKYMPHRHFQDLIEHHDLATQNAFKEWHSKGSFNGVFKEKVVQFDGEGNILLGRDGKPKVQIKDVLVEADRPDRVFKGLKRVYQMTEEMLAHDGEGPINYAEAVTMTAVQQRRLTEVCKNLGTDKGKYLDIMKTLSDHVGTNAQLEALTQPEYFDTYRMTQDLDAREKYLDQPTEAPGSQYQAGKKDVPLVSAQIEIKMSSETGGEKGKGLQSGLGRVVNDDAGATENAMNLATIIGARAAKQILEVAPEFAKKILFVAGNQTKSRGVAIAGGAWARVAKMDTAADWGIYGSMVGDAIATSPLQRVGVKGEHGDASMTKNELHHFWNDLQTAANLSFVRDIKWLNSEIERDLGLIWKFKFFGSEIETGAPLRIYQYYLWGLMGLGLVAVKTAETAQEELDGTPGKGH